MRLSSIFVGSVVAISQSCNGLAAAGEDLSPTQPPKEAPEPGSLTSQGCFSSSGNLTAVKLSHSSATLSSGSCADACQQKGFTVMALQPGDCLCGMVYPPESSITDDEDCNFPCTGYPMVACGGLGKSGFSSVYNLGVEIQVPFYTDDDSTQTTASGSSVSSTNSTPLDTSSTVKGTSATSSTTSEAAEPSITSSGTSGPSTTSEDAPSSTTAAAASETTSVEGSGSSFYRGTIVGSVVAGVAAAVAGSSFL